MSDCARSPFVVERDLAQWRAAIERDRRSYTPEWNAAWRSDWINASDFGQALAAIAARNLDVQTLGINAMPLRMQLEFLDRIGASVLPAQSARAPLVFKLLDTATGDATVPAGTRVAAVLPPPAPSLDSSVTPRKVAPPEFYTETEITAMRGQLAVIYSIDPHEDVYADHTASVETGFSVFDRMSAVPHRLYLGHAELFRLSGIAQIVLTINFAARNRTSDDVEALQRPLLLDWEYLSVNGWLPLTLVEDRTQRFSRDGRIVLSKLSGPDAKDDTILGHSAYWIRGTVSSRVPAARIIGELAPAVPTPDEIELEVEDTRELLTGDVVTIDGVTQAIVLRTSEQTVTLDKRLAGAVRGEYLALANALPPLRPDGADEAGVLPRVDTIRARVGFARTDLVPDKALLDSFSIDFGKDFYPFGAEPARFASFYVACKEAFARKGARIELDFAFAEAGTGNAVLVVEYFNGDRWLMLGPDEDLQDTTDHFTVASKHGVVSFIAPLGWEESEINGERHFWLRFRLVSGNYGKPLELSVSPDPADPSKYIVTTVPSTLKPPVVKSLRIGYIVLSNPVPLEFCIAENDFALIDFSENARWSRSTFAPFTPIGDRTPALHFAFSGRPPAALVSVLLHVLAPAGDAAAQPFIWEYWSRDGWTELSVRDTTFGLQQTGLIQFVGQADAEPHDGLGGALFRIRARLKTGLSRIDYITRVGGAWLNAVWAAQGTRYARDALGISNGEPDQTYALPTVRATGAQAAVGDAQLTARDSAEFERALSLAPNGVPVLGGEEVEVREWQGRGDDWETAVAGVPAEDLRFEADPKDPSIKTAVWVRWHPQPHLYASHRNDRHYVVERARGVFRFPGAGARVPPAGAPIVVSYVTGGGVEGNVEAGALRELRSGVGFVESVRNPLPASGGAITESLRAARDRGVQAVRHRDRAVSREDFEWLAREASSEVARARALPLEAPAGSGGRGFVGIVIVPHSIDAAPMPSRELSTRVLEHLRLHAPAGIAGGIRIVTPSYVKVGVRAEILPQRADEAGKVEARVRARLLQFAHPLAGGRDQRGWDFGDAIYLSDVAALIEETPGVDAVRFLQLMVGSAVYGDRVSVAPEQLIAAGDSQLKILVPSAPYALA